MRPCDGCDSPKDDRRWMATTGEVLCYECLRKSDPYARLAAFLAWLDAEIEAARQPGPQGHLGGEELRREATRSALERVKARLVR